MVAHRWVAGDGSFEKNTIDSLQRLQTWPEGGRIRLSEDDGPAATEFLDDDDDDDGPPIVLGRSLPDVESEAHGAWEREEGSIPSPSLTPTPAVAVTTAQSGRREP